tara:strand:+ start:407 stop:898 length:492 start_codon:yes stop_codon:yes gene_type:complete
MKIFHISLLISLNIMLSADLSQTINDFFKQELNFEQNSFNSATNNFEKSFGKFKRNSNNTIEIEVFSPFNEKYFISSDGIEIYDLDFDQKKFIRSEDISNVLLDILNNGFSEKKLDIKHYDEKKFSLTKDGKEYSFTFLNINNLQIKYKDNMNVDTLINFSIP